MKRKSKAIAFTLSFSLLFSTFAYAQDIEDIEKEINKSENNKKLLEQELQKVDEEIEVLQEKLKEINEKISKTEVEIEKSKNKIANTEKEIEKTEAFIEQKEIELAEKKETLRKNVRTLYSKGEVSFLEVLFRSESLSNFLYRFDAMQIVANSHKELHDQIKEEYELLKIEKEKLEKLKEQQIKDKNKLVRLKNTQTAQKEEQQSILNELEARHVHLEGEIEKEEQAIELMHQQIADIIRKREEEKRRLEEERKRQQQENKKQTEIPYKIGSGKLSIPLAQGSYYISSHYGYRTHPIYGTKHLHNGTDFAAPYGTPIYAADSGTVLFARPASGYGHWIVIDHNNGLYTIYGHMYGNQIYVKEGQQVERGQHIAAVGSDGTSTGNHLHFCVATGYNGYRFNYVNPMNYF